MKAMLLFLLVLMIAVPLYIEPVSVPSVKNSRIEVTVQGAVEREGTITLPAYASVQDALDLCGLKDSADVSGMNPLTILKDRDLIFVPEETTDESSEKISINTASLEELCQLPGIGESTAQKIIDYRKEYGLFQSLEDLMNVKGIGEGKFAKIREMIRL